MASLSKLAVGCGVLILLVACPAPPPPVDASFSIDLSPTSTMVQPGEETAAITVTVARDADFDAFVELDVEGLPPTFAAFIEHPGTGDEGSMVIDVPEGADPATHEVEVVATGAGESVSATFELIVVLDPVEPTFSLSLSPDSVTVVAGESSETITATLERDPGFDAAVELDVEDLPVGFGASLSDPGTGDTGEIVIIVPEDVEPDTHVLTVVAAGGGVTATAELIVTVVGDPVDPGTGSIEGRLTTANDMRQFVVPEEGMPGLAIGRETPSPGAYVPNQVLVQYRHDIVLQLEGAGIPAARSTLAAAVVDDHGFGLLRRGNARLPDVLKLSAGDEVAAAVARLSSDPRVAYAEPNYYLQAQSLPNDPLVDRAWHLPVAGVPVAWHDGANAADVTVAVVDTGIDLEHEDLAGIFLPGYDFCAAPDCAEQNDNPRPDSANDVHGTFMTGLIAAVGNNATGVAGVLHEGASIVPVKTFYDGFSITAEAAARSIQWAAGLSVPGAPPNGNPADIISMSFGAESDITTLRNAVEAAQGAGALLIASAGNSGADLVLFPAAYDGVIGVGSVNSELARSCFSNYGPGLDIMAAGGEFPAAGCDEGEEFLVSTLPLDEYGNMAGTSQASAIVAGTAALVWSAQAGPSASSVANALLDTAYFEGAAMDHRYGNGILRADDALGLLGPADGRHVDATLTADGPATAAKTVAIDLLRGFSPMFTLSGLEAGTYVLEAAAFRTGASLTGSTTVTVEEDETQAVELRVSP